MAAKEIGQFLSHLYKNAKYSLLVSLGKDSLLSLYYVALTKGHGGRDRFVHMRMIQYELV